jgi:predicted nucleic acid-binding protein
MLCLDSWAILAWLEGAEPAATRVEIALKSRPLMSWINLGEVAYILERRTDPEHARQVVRDLRRTLNLELPTEARVLDAARIKARHRMAYADAFAVATAVAHGADLLTGDPEILEVDADWRVVDLRQ